MNFTDIVIPFVGGLALFIYGMQIMAEGLQNAAGNKMKKLLEALTKNKVMGVLLGATVTAIIQSSSATTVMVVGFVNAGLMNLYQAMSLIMGANIGTTTTGWLVSSVEWAKFLSPTTIAPLAVMLGVILLITTKKHKDIAGIIIGFGILFVGIQMMSNAVYPLRDSPTFKTLFVTLGHSPFLGILAGAAVTALVQSSSASVGILQTLAASGLVPFNAAVYIIMGQNIGTCVTAMLSSIGASKNAKSAAYMHLLFNIIGTVLFSILAIIYFKMINPALGMGDISQTQISGVHTAFNITTTLLLFPFSGVIINMAKKLNRVPEDVQVDESALVHLDDRVLETPSMAVQCAVQEVVRMGHIVEENLVTSTRALREHNGELAEQVRQREHVIDSLCDGISEYLVKICNLHINERENGTVTSLLTVLGDMERVGDHCENLAELAEAMAAEEILFSDTAKGELDAMVKNTEESFISALKALEFSDVQYAHETVRKEDIVDDMETKLRTSHINRLANNLCNARSGVRFLDTLTNLERISDHALNIAQVVLNENRQKKYYHDEKYVAE